MAFFKIRSKRFDRGALTHFAAIIIMKKQRKAKINILTSIFLIFVIFSTITYLLIQSQSQRSYDSKRRLSESCETNSSTTNSTYVFFISNLHSHLFIKLELHTIFMYPLFLVTHSLIHKLTQSNYAHSRNARTTGKISSPTTSGFHT